MLSLQALLSNTHMCARVSFTFLIFIKKYNLKINYKSLERMSSEESFQLMVKFFTKSQR